MARTLSVKPPPLNKVMYPESDSEFEIQAELYRILTEKGISVRGNVWGQCLDGDTKINCFFDLVIYTQAGIAIAIIECKNRNATWLYDGDGIGAKQKRRYALFGLPIISCLNRNQIFNVVDEALRLLDHEPAPSSELWF